MEVKHFNFFFDQYRHIFFLLSFLYCLLFTQTPSYALSVLVTGLDGSQSEVECRYRVIGSSAEIAHSRLYRPALPPGTAGEVQIPSQIDGLPVFSIGHDAFFACSNITSVVVPEGVTRIATRAFWNCLGLERVKLPKSLRKIDTGAFRNCSSLREVVIPKSTRLGYAVFFGCTNLIRVTLPSDMGDIPESAFRGCSSLSELKIPSSVTNIGICAFADCRALRMIDLPQPLTRLGIGAFDGCLELREINLPKDIEALPDAVFHRCVNLRTISLPQAVSTIGENSFADCYMLEEITLPTGVVSIGTCAFFDCCSLKSITLPQSLQGIGSRALAGFSSLQEIKLSDENSHFMIKENCLLKRRSGALIAAWGKRKVISLPQNVRDISECAFDGCPLVEQIEIPADVTHIDPRAFNQCSTLKEIVVASGNPLFKSVDGVLYSRDGDRLIRCPCGFQGSHYSVCAGCRKLERNAFCNCRGLESVSLPSSLVEIGGFAFDGCDRIPEIVIPSGVNTLNNMAFGSCKSLRVLRFMGVPANVSRPICESAATNLVIQFSGPQKCDCSNWLIMK